MDFLHTLKLKNELLFYFGWFCLVMAIICLVFTRTSSLQVLGTSAWWKPFKFWISTVILGWSVGFYMQYLRDRDTGIAFVSYALVGLFLIENIWITYKASMGQLSHFNLNTPLDRAMYSVMASAAAGISLSVAYVGILFLSEKTLPISQAYLWGIRLGILLFVIFSLQGFSMGARLSHTVGAADGSEGLPLVNWSKKYGDLRIAHFMGMHALQIVPLVAYYLLKDALQVMVFALIYGGITCFLFYQALQGRPFLRL